MELEVDPLLPMLCGRTFVTSADVARLRPFLLGLRDLLKLLPKLVLTAHDSASRELFEARRRLI